MKKNLNLVFTALLLSVNMISMAQSNNPYDQRGVDYMSSMQIISNDVKTRGVKDLSQSTLDYYSGQIPLQTQASAEMAGTILRTIKTPGFNLSAFVDNSALSMGAKHAIKDIYTGSRDQTREAFRTALVTKVDHINGMALAPAEKELVLSLAAITYHAASAGDHLRLNPGEEDSPCVVFGGGGSAPIPCWVAGATFGGVAGWLICGPLCALGGAVIGGVIGAICE
ncbi:MAG TPA: hypothetical protein VK489_14410 [Ferruginibacter sp.]|nr:hypothetical protein [Ferruginibacter sp.]